ISFKKLTCSQGESKQAPLPHTINGRLFFPLNPSIFFGLKMVWVGREASVSISALNLPVPPFSITREAASCAKDGAVTDKMSNNKTYFIFFMCVIQKRLKDESD